MRSLPVLIQLTSGEIFEYAVLVALKLDDDKALERAFAQLKVYYFDYKNVLAPSERAEVLLGVWLVYLLTQNLTGDFHTELERIENHDSPNLKFAIDLEQLIMEGRYNKLGEVANNPPSPLYLPLTKKLLSSSRSRLLILTQFSSSSPQR